ncbi:Kelch domain protein [Labilithrix luteola]|uniref:Kelch domain protein n=1 Tax=Labilithrix luteola TaxID=1391654 RepID=A0A0K1Q3C5_9BACT|nr:Kelch domain protein [Labilithrix luteola]
MGVVSLLLVACSKSDGDTTRSSTTGKDEDRGIDAAPRPLAADPTSWRKTGDLTTARYGHTATLLSDGTVLVVGGENAKRAMMASVEIFDPQTETWRDGPSLPEPRSNHVAVALVGGKVLVVGGGKNAPIGQPLGEGVTASALLFDPASGAFSATGQMHHARSHFRAVRLPSGQVLVAGGGGDVQESPTDCAGSPYCGPFGKAQASAEIYDPASGEWSEVASMATARYSFSMTALSSGRALVVGGVNAQAEGFASTELYDPETNTWSNGPPLDSPREHHSATLLGTGRVLVAGGKNPNVTPLASVVLFDPATPSWTDTRKLASPRTVPGLVALESGHALVAGGFDQLAQVAGKPAYVDEALIYDDTTKGWSTIAPLGTGRLYHSLTLLADGRVLVVGGLSAEGELATCEVSEATATP